MNFFLNVLIFFKTSMLHFRVESISLSENVFFLFQFLFFQELYKLELFFTLNPMYYIATSTMASTWEFR